MNGLKAEVSDRRQAIIANGIVHFMAYKTSWNVWASGPLLVRLTLRSPPTGFISPLLPHHRIASEFNVVSLPLTLSGKNMILR